MTDLNLDSLVVGLGFPPAPPQQPQQQPTTTTLPPPPQPPQPPLSPHTIVPPAPISPPNNSVAAAVVASGGCVSSTATQGQAGNTPQHSNLDPNARIYTPKGVGNNGVSNCNNTQQEN